MDHLTIAHIDSDMRYWFACIVGPCKKDQISRLCIAVVHTGTAASLLIGRTGNAVTDLTVDAEGKSGTIRTIRQAGTARHIRITYVLPGIFCKPLSHITAGGTYDD